MTHSTGAWRSTQGRSSITACASAAQVHRLEQQRSRCRPRQLEQRGHGVRHLARRLALQAQPFALVLGQALPGAALEQIGQAGDLADRRAQLVRQLARKGFEVAVALLQLGGAFGDQALERLVAVEQHALGAFPQRDVAADAVVADECATGVEARLAADGDPAQAAAAPGAWRISKPRNGRRASRSARCAAHSASLAPSGCSAQRVWPMASAARVAEQLSRHRARTARCGARHRSASTSRPTARPSSRGGVRFRPGAGRPGAVR